MFAYTIKGRGLPTEGHPNNHSALLTAAQMQALAEASGMDPARPWQRFDPGTAAAGCASSGRPQLHREPATPSRPVAIPAELGHPHRKPVSTQAALGRFLADLAHDAPRGGRASGHLQPRRRLVDQPRRLDQQDRGVVGAGPARLVRR